MNRWLKGLAIAATLIMFLVMIAGSLVTKTESGMGCGSDWPLCNGKFVPEYTLESMIEYSHRLVTGVAGIVVLVFAVASWWTHRGNKEVLATAWFAGFFIILESILGASAVIWPQSSSVLALHFGFSLLAYSGVFLLTAFILQRDRTKKMVKAAVSKGLRIYVWLLALYAYGVVYLGAYVRHTDSSLACYSWPTCRPGELIPPLTDGMEIQMAHRLAAMLFFFLVAGLWFKVLELKETRRDLFIGTTTVLVLVVLQIFSGALVVWSELHLYYTILHSAIITILFGVLCYLCVQVLKKPESNRK